MVATTLKTKKAVAVKGFAIPISSLDQMEATNSFYDEATKAMSGPIYCTVAGATTVDQ